MKHSILAASILLFAACGGDEPSHKGMINATGARTSVESVHDVFAALDTANGESAADAVMVLAAAGQIVVTPAEARTLPAEAYLPPSWPRSKLEPASFTGSADCDASGCTFVDFENNSEHGLYRINGSIRRTGDVLAFDLTYDFISDEIAFRWEMDGNVRANATLIDGYVRSHGTGTVVAEDERTEIVWEFDIDFDNIILDGEGCPVGGALAATVAYDVAGAGSIRASGSVRFGPACGQLATN